MSETSMREVVIKVLTHLDAVAVENSAGPGTPDVNYVEGWIELKHAEVWPVKPKTPLRLEHFTPEQRNWIRKRYRHAGAMHVVLQVKREWFILEPMWAADFLGLVPRHEIVDNAIRRYPKGLDKEDFLQFFKEMHV